MQLSTQFKMDRIKAIITQKGISLNKSYNELTDENYWKIREELGIHIKSFSHLIKPQEYVISSSENTIIKYIKAILQKKPIMDLGVLGKVMVSFICLMAFVAPILIISLW